MAASPGDDGLRLGLADHFGWAVAVTASADHHVVDRRRIELVEPGVPAAPFHQDSKRLDLDATAELVARVRASIARSAAAAFDELEAAVGPIGSVSLRAWSPDFPTDLEVLVRVPWEARADGVMYRQVVADVARERGWAVHLYGAKEVVNQATARLGDRAKDVLHGPRARLGPPWAADHRMALAATVMAVAPAG
ncbi:MAG TPA: hypothetical protein VIL36_04885 [Acidimicrobiales bacterium]